MKTAKAGAPAAAASGTRIAAAFARCRDRGEAALVTYVMGGDPDLATSRAMALACVEGGADLLEIGIPFSDPMADGPTIQHAAERALASGTTPDGVLEVAAAVRARSDVPIALMGYLNPILARGVEPLRRRLRPRRRGRAHHPRPPPRGGRRARSRVARRAA